MFLKKNNNTYFLNFNEKRKNLYFLKNKNLFNSKKYKQKKKVFIILEKEIIHNCNNIIDTLFKNKINSKNYYFQKNNKIDITSLILFFKKNKNLTAFGRKKQYLYNVLSLCFSLQENFKFLILKELFRQSLILNKQKLNFLSLFNNFYQEHFFNITFQKRLKGDFTFFNNKNILNFYYFGFYFSFLEEKNLYAFFLEKSFFEKKIAFNIFWRKKYYFSLNLNEKLRISNAFSLFQTNNLNFISLKKNGYFLNFIKSNFLKKKLNLSSYIWKNSSIKSNNIFIRKKKKPFSRIFASRELSNKILFLLLRLYEKSKKVYYNQKIKTSFKTLKDVFIFEIFNAINKKKVKSLLLLKHSKIKNFKKSLFFFNKKNKNFQYNIKKLDTNLSFSEAFNFNTNKNAIYSKDKNFLMKKKIWKEKKLVQKDFLTRTNQVDKIFSFFFSEVTSVFFINALTLTKFSFLFPKKTKSVNTFLKKVETEMISKYKYIAVYIQDLVRISFLSLFLKKPAFLASFIGFQIEKLPKNRKETKFIRFIIKVVKIFSAQQKEMISLKIEFKGRVNRWRRTKIIKGLSGVLSKSDYQNRIEYGTGKAINRKGALGIRLWFYYEPIFEKNLKLLLYNYIKYSQNLHLRIIKKFFNKFKSI